MINGLSPASSVKGDAYDEENTLPVSMHEALALFEGAHELREVLGPEFARVYEIVKRKEYEEFLEEISPWEREHLLLNV